MLLTNAEKILQKSGYRFLSGHILKDNMPYGFYTTSSTSKFGTYSEETIYQVKTCSREVAAVMVVSNVNVIKY